MREQVMELLLNVLLLLATLLVTMAIAWLEKRRGVEGMIKLKEQALAKKDLAREAVLFVQQLYEALNGPEKYRLAAEYFANRVTEKGFTVTGEEIEGMIESTLKEVKKEFGIQWESATAKPEPGAN